MFKEVLHHTYKLGLAVNTASPDDPANDGVPVNVGFTASGREAGSGAALFIDQAARIHVDAGGVWDHPLAVQIDAWVLVQWPATPRRLNILEADRSFAFFIQPDASLWGTVLAPTGPGATPSWHGANTLDNPVGMSARVPLGRWTKLTYLHDGFGTLRLYIDGTLVARNTIYAGVPQVQASGIEIGHWVGDDRYTFSGAIDDVRVAVYDPDAIGREFQCRLGAGEGQCWESGFSGMATLLETPEAARSVRAVMACLEAAQRDLVRAIVQAGGGSKAELAKLRERWLKVWCGGGSPAEAAVLMDEFIRLFERILGPAQWCALLSRMVACVQLKSGRMSGMFAQIAKCDPWYAELIKQAIKRGVHQRCDEINSSAGLCHCDKAGIAIKGA